MSYFLEIKQLGYKYKKKLIRKNILYSENQILS
mgnify:CR=1 FL=1